MSKPNNDIAELRGHLFDTLRSLKDKDAPMDIARAKAVCDVAEQITDTARIEIELMKVTQERVSSDFLPAPDGDYPPGALPGARRTAQGVATVQAVPGATVTTHRLRG
ncbi:hypothetical protein [Niveibacterium sp. SC-1]|uniref:hypothetical protein n=1 Tax=Niveibacterium sp. SC-1 TaxID=3135646 RepID=UPI00311D57EC